MKTIIAFLLIYPCLLFAQTTEVEPVKKANKITIKTGKTNYENFALLQTVFANKGYTVLINRKNLTATTKDSLIESRASSYVLSGVAKQDSIILWGNYRSTVVTTVFSPEEKTFSYDISNIGAKGSVPQQMFQILKSVALELPGIRSYHAEKKKRNGAIF